MPSSCYRRRRLMTPNFATNLKLCDGSRYSLPRTFFIKYPMYSLFSSRGTPLPDGEMFQEDEAVVITVYNILRLFVVCFRCSEHSEQQRDETSDGHAFSILRTFYLRGINRTLQLRSIGSSTGLDSPILHGRKIYFQEYKRASAYCVSLKSISGED